MDTLQCTVSDCGVPVILRADMNSVERWDGIGVERRMRLQCLSPYSRKGSGVILCQKDGQWKTDILCGFEFQGHFYRFHSEATTWEGAKARCNSFGGYLVELDTGNERDWIFTTFIAPNFRQEDCQKFYDCGSWTGGRVRDGELTFVWSRGGNPIGNNLWYDGQPNNNGDDQDCVELTRQSGLLNDRGCLTPNAFICEWDP
ncbi:macrophage mannose receptor 1-like [Saccostrea echinata]|uniref:macrophage mannose receptor 1-like n=1 Tax=Saccostrea echinata TaxID=191078 RepID=UPI002A805B48|nr:macrophage mannose receptor 1-like [Saccostrea echinata]